MEFAWSLIGAIPKQRGEGLTPLKLEHGLLFVLGACLAYWSDPIYASAGGVGQIIILVVYLGLLIGIAPVPMPIFSSKAAQVAAAGLLSGVLDSFIILLLCRKIRTKEINEDVRVKFLALCMISALIGGLIIWFGEVYAAGLYNSDGRTGALSALYVVPPVAVFLAVLGWHASRLSTDIVADEARPELAWRDVSEFVVGIILLLATHNPLLCLGILLIYAVLTRQGDRLIGAWKHETEVNVMLVLFIALTVGRPLVDSVIVPLGLHQGTFLPIIPAAVQAPLWGPLYEDPTVHFWMRLTTLSTGALLLPTSSLVGVMLFSSWREWKTYIKMSVPYAILWYALMRGWMALTLETPVGAFLERWAHTGGH